MIDLPFYGDKYSIQVNHQGRFLLFRYGWDSDAPNYSLDKVAELDIVNDAITTMTIMDELEAKLSLPDDEQFRDPDYIQQRYEGHLSQLEGLTIEAIASGDWQKVLGFVEWLKDEVASQT